MKTESLGFLLRIFFSLNFCEAKHFSLIYWACCC